MSDFLSTLAELSEHTMSAFRSQIPFIMEGIVLDTNDPDQMGRVRAWVPSIDGELYDKTSLPWCEYASPLAGYTTDFKAGRQNLQTQGQVPYGFWAIPKIGSQVLIFCLNGDANRRFFFGSYYPLHGNRGLPDGRNINRNSGAKGRFSEAYDYIRPAQDNLQQQFGGNLDASEAQTRGAYERQAAQDLTKKDGTDGYAINTVDDTELDSQTYCWVTPGHHAIIMQDTPENCRLRIKTCEGNQIILDDSNERIYISTARGGAWLEFDEDGHIHFFAAESFSIQAGKDINMTAGNNINIEAKNSVNVKAVNGTMSLASAGKMSLSSTGENLHLTACMQLHAIGATGTFVNGETLNLTSSAGTFMTNGTFDLLTQGKANLKGSPCTVNAGSAARSTDAVCGKSPDAPAIVPSHEPWKRPSSSIKRNPFWKA